MSFLSGLKSLFTAGPAAPEKEEDPIDYKGFIIIPAPINEGGQHRVAATITKGEGDSQQIHKFIRSDLIAGRDECITVTINKAKMTIDQLGDRLFN
ncbi:HlyU family transcriptional regulator [Marinomonas algicola]|uniref:HlyU family transcriptional regulator n=1 Tax=Marinomonas algicola TaxID=2773454 RepID=UPI00174C3CDE|nr:HlyU family transcriptional regulator [Marinomonas algicola]